MNDSGRHAQLLGPTDRTIGRQGATRLDRILRTTLRVSRRSAAAGRARCAAGRSAVSAEELAEHRGPRRMTPLRQRPGVDLPNPFLLIPWTSPISARVWRRPSRSPKRNRTMCASRVDNVSSSVAITLRLWASRASSQGSSACTAASRSPKATVPVPSTGWSRTARAGRAPGAARRPPRPSGGPHRSPRCRHRDRPPPRRSATGSGRCSSGRRTPSMEDAGGGSGVRTAAHRRPRRARACRADHDSPSRPWRGPRRLAPPFGSGSGGRRRRPRPARPIRRRRGGYGQTPAGSCAPFGRLSEPSTCENAGALSRQPVRREPPMVTGAVRPDRFNLRARGHHRWPIGRSHPIGGRSP